MGTVEDFYLYICFLSLCVVGVVVSIVRNGRRRKWKTVNGVVTHMTVEGINWEDNSNYITYQFYYEGILYENVEEFYHERHPSKGSEIVVYINPKSAFKSTIKPPRSLIKIVIGGLTIVLFIVGWLLYQICIAPRVR